MDPSDKYYRLQKGKRYNKSQSELYMSKRSPYNEMKKTQLKKESTQLLQDNKDEILGTVIKLAKEGDTQALKLCLDRLIAPTKSNKITLGMSRRLKTIDDCVEAQSEILEKVASGDIYPHEAEYLTENIEKYLKTLEVRDLAQRIEQLEKRTQEESNNSIEYYDAKELEKKD